MSSKADEAAADDPVVSLTFSCFGESVGIFKDAFWTDVMAGNAYRISKAGGIVEDHSSLGLAAATMLFYQARTLIIIQSDVSRNLLWTILHFRVLKISPSLTSQGERGAS